MEPILFLAHTEADGTLARGALETLAAAVSMGGAVTVGLVGPAVDAAFRQIASCEAVRFLAVEGEPFGQSRYSTDAAAVEALCRAAGASLVLAPHTSRWARAIPGAAARLNGRADTHATGIAVINEVPAVTRWFYRQRMEAVLTRSPRPWFVLLESGCAAAWSGPAGEVPIERVEVAAATRSTVTGVRAPQSGEETIRPDAKLLFVAGAGWTKKQSDGVPHPERAEQLILGFLRGSHASLGSSKSLVDQSGEGQSVLQFMTHLNQIGQTGATPRHPKGLSTCCHGEEPHVVGWRFITERRAINLDANCGWARGKADVVYIADAFEVMEQVNRLLKGQAQARDLQ
jgi:electron transfer flavoprotein alpha subunit